MKRFIYWYQKTPDWAKWAILSQVGLVIFLFIQYITDDYNFKYYPFTFVIALGNVMIPFAILRIIQFFQKPDKTTFFVQQGIEAIAIIFSAIPLTYWNVFSRYLGIMVNAFNNKTDWKNYRNEPDFIPYMAQDMQDDLSSVSFLAKHETELLIYIAIVMVVAIVRAGYKTQHYIQSAEQAEQLAHLKAQNTRSHLRALQARINPHFLYNALNNIAGLTHEKPDQAEQMAVSLATLFREALNKEGQDYSTVEQELEIIQHYLTIEKIRFGDALQYQIDVQPNTRTQLIPRFLLQPLVENAVKHGIEPDGKGRIRVKIEGDDSKLVISVEDSGKPFPDPIEGGYGLQNVQDNLELLFPNRHTIELKNATDTQAKQIRLTLEMSNIAQVRAQYIAPVQYIAPQQ